MRPLKGILLILGLIVLLQPAPAPTKPSPPTTKTSKNKELEERVRILEKQLMKKSANQKNRIALGEALFELGNYDRVIEVLQPHMELLPRSANLIIANAHRAQKKYLEEIRVYKHLVNMNTDDYLSHTELGRAYTDVNKPEEAILAYRKAIEIRPQHRPAYEALLKEYNRIGNHYESRLIVEDMIQYFGAKPDYLNELCRLYTVENYKDTAIDRCNLAVRKQPSNPDNHIYLGLNYKNSGDTAQATKILLNAAKRFPKSEHAQWVAGQVSEEAKNFLAAYTYYKQAIAADAASARSHLGLARSAFELKKYKESLDSFSKACPQNKEASEEFRKYAYRLRHLAEESWHEKFLGRASECN